MQAERAFQHSVTSWCMHWRRCRPSQMRAVWPAISAIHINESVNIVFVKNDQEPFSNLILKFTT